MRIDEFNKYKRLAESQDPSVLMSFPEAEKIHNWMQETGRIDEGIFSAIWSWLKRNFSPTARKIHSLADEYENELKEELRAEWKKSKDPKDLAAKFRAGSYNRLSRDIQERMEIIAEDDETYRDLVRTLINKKDLEVKKALLKELAGQIDPDDFNQHLGPYQKEVERDYSKANEEYEKAAKKLTMDKKDVIDDIINFMTKKLNSEKTQFREIGISTSPEQVDFIKLMYVYVNYLSEKMKGVNFDGKTVYKYSKEYLDLVKQLSKKLENEGEKRTDAIETVKSHIDSHIKKTKNVLDFDKIKSIVTSEIAKRKKKEEDSGDDSSDADIEDAVTTDHTTKVMNPDEVEDAIDTAKDETGKEEPTVKDVVSEIKKELNTFLSDDNVDYYLEKLNEKIEKFNALSPAERKMDMKDYDYELDKDSKIKPATTEDVKNLVETLINVTGLIFPYFEKMENNAKEAARTTLRYIFEIYALKKDTSKKLSVADTNKLIANMKEKKYI